MRLRGARTPTITAAIGVSAALAATGCSGGDDQSGEGPTTTVLATPATSEPSNGVEAGATTPASTTVATTVVEEPAESTEPPFTTFAVVEVPETGVPGLDSDDSFCAAWSRFGGSWQVIQVAANFAPDPSVTPVLEVTAAPVVAAAFDAMFADWPTDLIDEREAVADGFFGPLDRRAEAALDALGDAGATADQLTALGDAWEAALAARVPDEPVVSPELDETLRTLVDTAAATFAGRLVDFVDDPTMRIVVETPLTDAYLSTACPDQGALTGGEVDAS